MNRKKMDSDGLFCNYYSPSEEEVLIRKKRDELKRYLKRMQPPPKLTLSDNLYISEFGRFKNNFDRNFDEFEKNYFLKVNAVLQHRKDICLFISLYFAAIAAYLLITLLLQLRVYRNLQIQNTFIIANVALWEFHSFYSVATILLMIWSIYCLCRIEALKDKDVHVLNNEVISNCHDEYCMDIKAKLKDIFLIFSQSLKENFIVSSDLSQQEIRKIYRDLNFHFEDIAALIDCKHKGSSSIYNQTLEASYAVRFYFWILMFFLPSCISAIGSLFLVYKVFDSAYYHHHIIKLDTPQILTGLRYDIFTESEGLLYIGLVVALHAGVWLMLLATSNQSNILLMLRKLYTPMQQGAVHYCNCLLSRGWDAVVIEGVLPFILELKAISPESSDLVSPQVSQLFDSKTPLLAGSAPPPTSNAHSKRFVGSMKRNSFEMGLERRGSVVNSISNGSIDNYQPDDTTKYPTPLHTLHPPHLHSTPPHRGEDIMEFEMKEIHPDISNLTEFNRN